MRLYILQSTKFKQSTAQSDTLPPEAVLPIEDNASVTPGFDIKGYTSEAGHYKVHFASPLDGKTTWYVFALHAVIQPDPDDKMYMRIMQDTFLKQETKQASELSDANKYEVQPGQTLDLVRYVPDPSAAQHLKVKLESPLNGIITWYAFGPHVEIASL
jgi:hypothetical protein